MPPDGGERTSPRLRRVLIYLGGRCRHPQDSVPPPLLPIAAAAPAAAVDRETPDAADLLSDLRRAATAGRRAGRSRLDGPHAGRVRLSLPAAQHRQRAWLADPEYRAVRRRV